MSENKVNIFQLAIALGIISAVATAALMGVSQLTSAPIKMQKIKATNDALKMVLPEFDNNPTEKKIIVGENEEGKIVIDLESNLIKNNKLSSLINKIILYPAFKGSELVGIAGEGISPKGFGGDVKAMLGMKPDGSIITGIITAHQETPGLGTNITDRVRAKTIFDILGMGEKVDESKLPPNTILDQFNNKVASNKVWRVKKDGGDIDYITGATISSRAVTDAFYKIASAFTLNKEKIITLLK
jgi:electron transport complex protein RnfG